MTGSMARKISCQWKDRVNYLAATPGSNGHGSSLGQRLQANSLLDIRRRPLFHDLLIEDGGINL